MAHPELWLIAGPNGAGKTTLVERGPLNAILPAVTFLNPDQRAFELLQRQGFCRFAEAPDDVLQRAFIEAANTTFHEIVRSLNEGKAIGVETVLSTEKYCPVVEDVLSASGSFFLIYVALKSPELAARRVQDRVRVGGHDVPETKILERWQRSLDWLPWFVQRATRFWIYDNSDSNPETPPLLLAEGENGICTLLRDDISEIQMRLKPFLSH